MANQSIGSPRFYLDFTQLAKIKGKYYWEDGVQNVDGVNYNEYLESNNDVWNFDFYKPTSFKLTWSDPTYQTWFFNFYPQDNIDKTWSRIASLSNWCGIFNHNIASVDTSSDVYFWCNDIPCWLAGSGTGMPEEIVNTSSFNFNGFSMMEFPGASSQDDIFRMGIGIGVDANNANDHLEDLENIKIGSMSFGKYYDLPNSPDLNIKKSIEYDGVKLKRGISGADFVNIENFGSPDWVSGEPWALVDPSESPSRLGRHGRRSWDMSYSYISNDDLFFDTNRMNVFGDLINPHGSFYNELSAGTEIQQIYDLTIGGALSFIFSPDPSATNPEFALCRLDQSSLSATQVAHQTWNMKIRVVEVW